MASEVVLQTNLPLPRFGVGKVRDTYDLGDRLLMVATDRISAFDCILPTGIPEKGRVLTQLSAFWFARTRELLPNHLLSTDTTDLPDAVAAPARDARRALHAGAQGAPCSTSSASCAATWRAARGRNISATARSAAAAAAWAAAGRRAAGADLHACHQGRDLATISTSRSKQLKNAVGEDLGQALADASLAIYRAARDYALDRGIILADTKLEFGLLDDELS